MKIYLSMFTSTVLHQWLRIDQEYIKENDSSKKKDYQIFTFSFDHFKKRRLFWPNKTCKRTDERPLFALLQINDFELSNIITNNILSIVVDISV